MALYFCENNGTSAAWTMPLSWPENNAPIFDSSYRKCYNKCNDDNKKAISHQSPKFALYGVFVIRDIKSCGTPENAVQTIYIKSGNTKNLKLYTVQRQRKTAYLYIQKGLFVKSVTSGYNIVIILPLAFPPWWW